MGNPSHNQVSKCPNNKSGFTVLELMIVVIIVAVLALISPVIMHGRVDASKWSEGRAGAGSVHTAARNFCMEKGRGYNYSGDVSLWAGSGDGNLGFVDGELDGTYFLDECYSISFTSYNNYTITVTAAEGSLKAPSTPAIMTLGVVNGKGSWN